MKRPTLQLGRWWGGVALGSLLTLVLAACASAAPPVGAAGPGTASGPIGPDMMGGPFGAGMIAGAIQGSATASVPLATADAAGRVAPPGAVVDRAANSVTFAGQQVAMTILGAPADGHDETFRLAGLTNPTIVVPAAAQVTLELINADAGMDHNWLLTNAQPPFAALTMMNAPVVLGAATETLPKAASAALPATTITFRTMTPGRYTYLCSVPGHAAKGMYGTFIVG
jgi:rusticyanin